MQAGAVRHRLLPYPYARQANFYARGGSMRGYYINSKNDEHGAIDVEPTLAEMYRLIDCDCIDIIVRHVNEQPFNIVLDDEGLLKPNRITAVSVMSDIFGTQEKLVGNMLIFGVSEEDDDLRGLMDDEVLTIQQRMVDAIFRDGTEHPTFWYSR